MAVGPGRPGGLLHDNTHLRRRGSGCHAHGQSKPHGLMGVSEAHATSCAWQKSQRRGHAPAPHAACAWQRWRRDGGGHAPAPHAETCPQSCRRGGLPHSNETLLPTCSRHTSFRISELPWWVLTLPSSKKGGWQSAASVAVAPGSTDIAVDSSNCALEEAGSSATMSRGSRLVSTRQD